MKAAILARSIGKARHVGRAFGRADRVDGAAGDRAAERHPDEERDQDQEHERHRDPGERREPGRRAIVEDVHGRGEIAERVGQRPVEVLVDLAARRRAQEQRDADIDRAGGERRDDRLDAAIDDDAAVDEAGERADREADDDAEQDTADAAGKVPRPRCRPKIRDAAACRRPCRSRDSWRSSRPWSSPRRPRDRGPPSAPARSAPWPAWRARRSRRCSAPARPSEKPFGWARL